MPNRQRTTVELPPWTVSRGRTYLNEKIHGEGREDLEPLREKVAETTPSDGRLELDRGEYQTFQRVVRDGAERELKQLEGQEANIFGDAGQQREAAREARQGVVNNPPQFGDTDRSADSPLFDVPVAPQATDIGRRASGRFDRTHREPEISTEPIARDQQTGRFQLDPFDITPGYEGAPPVEREPRKIEFGGEQVDLTQRDTEDLEQMNDFFTRNVDAEVDAERARGGFGTSDFAQEMSERQVEVASELDRRRR